MRLKIYDNGGETIDRYSIYDLDSFNEVNKLYDCLALSDNPTHPLGFSQWCMGSLGLHNGKEIKLKELKKELRQHIKSRFKD